MAASRVWLTHPLAVLGWSALATGAVALALQPLFNDGNRFWLYAYFLPIAAPFAAFCLDRLARLRAIDWRQWALELPLLALALARATQPIPLISGHAMFLAYALLTVRSATGRWLALLVYLSVVYMKIAEIRDPVTLIGGSLAGFAAGWWVRRAFPPE
ncbi:MAG TPA: hypothetical protein VGE07_16685 [Herpetosiphonaceae bacterium]